MANIEGCLAFQMLIEKSFQTGLMMYWCKKYQYEFNSVISPPSVQEIEMGPAEDSSLMWN
uniref:Uncharacterized protein n=1 Tax=Cucumis sativus TaxID=3659 RepID=A0A0A0KIJ2_CUCSA